MLEILGILMCKIQNDFLFFVVVETLAIDHVYILGLGLRFWYKVWDWVVTEILGAHTHI